jgi:nucleotide-binding universal stress UspA family protein
MYKKILIAIDGSELANRALIHGLALAKAITASVVIVTVTEGWSAMEMAHEARLKHVNPLKDFEDAVAKSAKRILDAAEALAAAAGVDRRTVHVSDCHPAEGIIGAASGEKCDLIVMASHGRRAVGRLLLGSQVNEVLAHCKIPALIVR